MVFDVGTPFGLSSPEVDGGFHHGLVVVQLAPLFVTDAPANGMFDAHAHPGQHPYPQHREKPLHFPYAKAAEQVANRVVTRHSGDAQHPVRG